MDAVDYSKGHDLLRDSLALTQCKTFTRYKYSFSNQTVRFNIFDIVPHVMAAQDLVNSWIIPKVIETLGLKESRLSYSIA